MTSLLFGQKCTAHAAVAVHGSINLALHCYKGHLRVLERTPEPLLGGCILWRHNDKVVLCWRVCWR